MRKVVKPKELISWGLSLLVAVLLKATGIRGVSTNPDSENTPTAIVFIVIGLFFFLRVSYRLIKKLGIRNR